MAALARRLTSLILLVVFVAGCATSKSIEPISRVPQSGKGKQITHESLAIMIAWSLWPDLAKDVRKGRLAMVWKPNGLSAWFEDEKTGVHYGSVIVSNLHVRGDSVLCQAVARYRSTSECILIAERFEVGRSKGWNLKGLFVLDTTEVDLGTENVNPLIGARMRDAVQLSSFSDLPVTFFSGSTEDTLYALVHNDAKFASVLELTSRRVENTIWWDILRRYRSVLIPKA